MILLRKCLVAVLGGALLIAGVAMLVLPGPAVVVIPAALAILAVEFLWARRWLAWLRERYKTISRQSLHLVPILTMIDHEQTQYDSCWH